MTLTYENNRYYRRVPLPPTVKYATETPSGRVVTVLDDGRVLIDDQVELSDPNSLALHDYKDSAQFLGYGPAHSGDGHDVVESNGYVTFAWMGATPSAGKGFGTPIWVGVWREGREPVRHPLGFTGSVIDSDPRNWRGPDNHCRTQLFLRETGNQIVALSGAHHGPLLAWVSHSPDAGYNFYGPYNVGPESSSPVWGHTYPAAVMVGDTLHVVSRFTTDGYQFHLVYWEMDTRTMRHSNYKVLDKAPDGHKYAVWYQQPRVDGDTLIVDTNRRWSKTGTMADLSEPEAKTFEVAL